MGDSELLALAASMGAFTATALLLGLIAGTFVYISEELVFRRFFNLLLFSSWLDSRYEDVPLSATDVDRSSARSLLMSRMATQWFSLPYKQLTGAIATAFQVTDEPAPTPSTSSASSPYPPHSSRVAWDLRSQFELIGRSILTRPESSNLPSRSQSPESTHVTAAASIYYAERALDDLQARLSVSWSFIRFIVGFAAIVVVFAAVAIFQYSSRPLGLLGALVTYPLIWIVAAFFAPVFRSIVETRSNRS